MFSKVEFGLIRIEKHCKLPETIRRNVCMKEIS